MPTYNYGISVELEVVFPLKGGGFGTDNPSFSEYVVITSSRKLGDAFLCNAAVTKAFSQARGLIPQSPGLAKAGARLSLVDCAVVSRTVV
jgi:hypothetical protein